MRIKYILPAILVALVLIVVALAGSKQQPPTSPRPQESPSEYTQPDTDTYQPTPELFISASGDSYESGGVIALSSTAEPAVFVSGDGVRGSAEVTVYRADEKSLLDYLTHNKEGKQIKAEPDAKALQQVTTLSHPVTSGRGLASKLVLPLDKSGIWFVRAKAGDLEETAFIVRSNVGALVKEADNEYLFWGQDFTTHRSISNGTVTVYNLQDSVRSIAQGSFNQDGISKTTLSADAHIALARSGQDIAIIPINLRYLNAEYQYTPFQPKSKETDFFTFTDRPLYKPGDAIYFKAVLRDDDDVRYTVPAGTASVEIYQGYGEDRDVLYDRQIPISADGTVAGEYKLPADGKTGYYSLAISLPTATTQQRVWYESVESYRKSTIDFQVEHFRKPEYSIDITTPSTELTAGDNSSFTISGQYFFGQPLAGQKVKYTIRSSDFYDYQYRSGLQYGNELSDDYRYGWESKEVKEGEVTLNEEGKAEVELPTNSPSDGKSKVFYVEATVDDGSGNPTFLRKNVLVHAGEYGIYRTDEVYGSKINTSFALPVVVVPRKDAAVSGVPLTATVQRENWVPYQEPDKKYPSYRQEKEDLPNLTATTDDKGQATFTFTPTKIGSYRIIVAGQDKRKNQIKKEFSAWITDKDQPLYTNEQNNELVIQTDKSRYAPTDTAVLTVTSNTVADRDVLLSLERARVNRFQVVRLNGKAGTVQVPLVATDIPNIYARVSSFSDESLESGDANIIVSTDSKKLVVNITPDKTKYGPSETVTLNIETTDNAGNPQSADTAVWAVDKALFELSDLPLGKIFDVFWRERYNNTQTAHSLEGISATGAEGGGCFAEDTPVLMGDGSTKSIKDVNIGDTVLTRTSENDARLVESRVQAVHSVNVWGYLILNNTIKVTSNHKLWINNQWQEAGKVKVGDTVIDQHGKPVTIFSITQQPGLHMVYDITIEKYHTYFAGGIYAHNKDGEARTVFKDTAYWNSSVHTDATGRAQVRFKLPDNLTTWRLSAIGSTLDTKVGQTSNDIVVAKDIIIRPFLPNILREGDTVTLEAAAQNFTDTDQTVDVSLQFDSGEIQTAPRSEVVLKARDSKTVGWKVAARTVNPKSKLVFSLQSKVDGKLLDSVTQEIPVLAFGFNEKRAETGNGSKTFSVQLAPDVDKQKTTLSLSLSPSVLGTLPEAMKYLVSYPYGCVEQTTSRLIPAIIAKRYPALFSESLKDRNIDEIITKGLDRLVQLQKDDGGWSWWSQGESDPFVTAYVVEYLVKAQQVGVSVNKSMLSQTQSYFENFDEVVYPIVSRSEEEERVRNVVKIYALSLLGSEKGKAQITDFQKLSPDLLSLAVMANVRNGNTDPATNGLAVLLSRAKKRGEGMFWESGDKKNFGSNDASTALAMRAILTSGGDQSIIAGAARLLTANRNREYWSNTFATAQVIQALSDFAQNTQENTPNYTYSIAVDDKIVGSGTITSSRQVVPEIKIAAADIKNAGSTITLTQTGNGPLYSTLVIDEFHTNRQAKAVDNGLAIKREYVSEKGEGKSLAVGDVVTVKLTVSGVKNDEYYAVIDDKLPAGLIPINTDFKNEQFNDQTQSYFDYTDREISNDGIVLYPYSLKAGEHTYTYKARVVSEGTFIVPPATAGLMYTPEVNGRSAVQTITTTRESITVAEQPKATVAPPQPIEAPKEDNNTALLTTGALLIIVVGFFVLMQKKGWLQGSNKTGKKDEPPLS